MKKIAEVNGHVSLLIEELQNVYGKYGDVEVTVCGVQPIQIYLDDENGVIVLDENADLED